MALTVVDRRVGDARPGADRFGSAYLLRVGEHRLLFDCGPGTTYKLARLGVRPDSISTTCSSPTTISTTTSTTRASC